MILVDTSIWIDHLHLGDQELRDLLESDEVCTHPFVIQELALGSLRKRDDFLFSLGGLRTLRPVSHLELLAFLNGSRLWGTGLSVVDAHLLAATRVTPGVPLWTRDKRLRAAADRLQVSYSAP